MNHNIDEEFQIQIDIVHALRDFLDAYDNHTEMVVTEAIANAIDVDATKVDIKFEGGLEDDTWVSFHNNGPAMNKKQFDDYHVLARSNKLKGKGIGFAGIGAKVYLAAWTDTIIHTESTDGTTSMASNMFIKNNELVAKYLEPVLKQPGTLYKIRLKQMDYDYLVNNLENIISNVFDPAILNGLSIKINGKSVNVWDPKCEFKKKTTVHDKPMKFSVSLCVTTDDLPVKKSWMQYHVKGKIITTKKPNWQFEVKSKFQKRIHVYIDAIDMSDQLNLNKTDFKTGHGCKIAPVSKIINKHVFKILKENKYIENSAPKNWENSSLTKFFDKLFKNPKYAFLNPGVRGGNDSGKGKGGGGSKTGKSKSGPQLPAEPKPRPDGGGNLSIGYVTPSNDKRDGWLDSETNKLMVNVNHPLYLKYENNLPARNQRMCHILTRVLIINSLPENPMDADEAFNLQTELSTLAKDEMW